MIDFNFQTEILCSSQLTSVADACVVGTSPNTFSDPFDVMDYLCINTMIITVAFDAE